MIQLFHVTKSYGDEPPTLDDLTLNIEKGEFVWLTGPSGAGKTTLLKLLFCAEAPTSGQILVGGRNVNRLTQAGVPILRRSIGVVFQDFKLLANRTVAENVGFALEVLGASDREIEERALKRLDQVAVQAHQQCLRFRVAKACVELQHLGPARGHHQSAIKHARERRTFLGHSADGGIDDVMHNPLRHARLQHLVCGVDAHAACIWPGIALANALVVLRGNQRHRMLAVTQAEKADLVAL